MASYQCRGKNKLWSVRFTIIDNGKEITKRLSGFSKKKDAELAYSKFISEYSKTEHKLDSDIKNKNFTTVFDEYFNYKKDKIKDSSLYDINNIYKLHIKPFFENYKIKEITKPICLQWQQTLNKYSYKYKTKIRGVLYSFYKYLYYYYDLDNIVSRVESFKKPNKKNEMQIWSLEEFTNFINSINDDILYKTFFTFLYYTGCRLGEALAINYNDFNFKQNSLKINKNITNKIYDKQEKQTYSITTPKNESSFRTILLPQVLINQLNDYIKNNPECKTSDFFFGLNKPLDDHTIYRRLEKYTKKSNNTKIRIHDFRHSHVSFLIQNGANIVLISKRVGHTDTQQTLNTYAHLFPNSEKELIDIIDNKMV